MDEKDAITRLKQGDITGLQTLVEMYQVKAVRTAVLITRDRPLAEDVVQSAFIRAYEKIHQFDASRPFAPWFLRSVANAAIQAARKNQRTVSLDISADYQDILTTLDERPAHQYEQHEREQHIREALEHLSPEQRAAIVMRYYLNMSEKDMADAADVPAGTIKWRLHQARRHLRGILKQLLTPVNGWERKS